MITGQKPIKKSKQGRFQILDVVAMMGPITKYTHQLASRRQYPEPGARGLPPRRGGEARRGPPRAARGRRRRAHRRRADSAQPRCAAPPPTRRRCARRSRRSRQAKSPVLVIGAGANRKMTGADAAPVRREDRHPVLHHADRQGRDRRAPPDVPRLRGAVGGRLRPPRDRATPTDRQRRPRRDREAAVLHDSAGGADGDPRLDQHRRGRSGLFPADRGDRRHRQRDLADQGGHRPLGRPGISTRCSARARPRSSTPRKLGGDARFPIFPPLPGRAGPRGDAGRRHHLPRQRRLQDLVRALLSGARSPTPCCSTTRWRRWARACRRRWRRRWSIPTAR